MTPAGIESATFRFVAQHLNHCATAVPPETWVLEENMANELMTFERKIMGKLFGPTRTNDGYWSIKTDQEINGILKGQNIFGFIKKQRLNWLGQVERVAEDNIVQKIERW
jgi:hypothetical protein